MGFSVAGTSFGRGLERHIRPLQHTDLGCAGMLSNRRQEAARSVADGLTAMPGQDGGALVELEYDGVEREHKCVGEGVHEGGRRGRRAGDELDQDHVGIVAADAKLLLSGV